MRVFLEGPDGSGKSTFARRLQEVLCKKYTTAYIHHTAYENSSSLELYNKFSKSFKLLQYVDVVIIDRCHISEAIYAPHPRLCPGMAEYEALNNMISPHDIKILFLPPLEKCLAVWRSRKEEEFIQDEEYMREVWRRYSMLPWLLRFDYTKQDTKELIRCITRELR